MEGWRLSLSQPDVEPLPPFLARAFSALLAIGWPKRWRALLMRLHYAWPFLEQACGQKAGHGTNSGYIERDFDDELGDKDYQGQATSKCIHPLALGAHAGGRRNAKSN